MITQLQLINIIIIRITDTLHEYQYTLMTISPSVLPRMRNVSDKICRENQKSPLMFNNFFFFENHARYEITFEEYCRVVQAADDKIIRRMRIACWIS